MSNKKVYTVVALGVLAVSFSPILIKATLEQGVSPDVAAFYRMLIASLLLAPFVLLSPRRRRSIAALSPKDKIITLVSGVFLALHFISWFFSLAYTSVFSSTVLVNLSPVFLLAVESLTAKRWPRAVETVGVIIALAGLVVLNWPAGETDPGTAFGNILAILAAVFMSGYLLCTRSVRGRLDVVPYSFLVYSVCTVGIFLWVVAAGRPLAGYTAVDFGLFAALAVVCTLLGHTLFQWAQRYIRPATLSVCILGEPVGAAILAYLLYSEVLGPLAYVGGAVLLAGIAVFNVKKRGNPPIDDPAM